MEVKTEPNMYDIDKICRACLNEKEDMQSIFVQHDSLGLTMGLAEVMMGFTTLQIENNDGLPTLLCIDCVQKASQCLSFKQLCEQSDANIRAYLGKPWNPKPCKQERENQQNSPLTLGFEEFTNDIQDENKFEMNLININNLDAADEKLIAKQQQPITSSKVHKKKSTKKKILAKSGKTNPKKLKRNTNQCNKPQRTGEKPFACKICNKGCYAESSLMKHMKIHQKKEGDPGLFKHICDYCKNEFPSAETLSVHIKQHTGDRPFLCITCGKCFTQRFNLELHIRRHTGERPFKCEVCKNGYVSKGSLKIHMRTHTNERPFVCDICGKSFRQNGDLTSHKRLHGTEKPIECSICQKTFTAEMKLKYHMRNHTGERPYVCNVCSRGFTINAILLKHMRVHSGERPYMCVSCGKTFTQSSSLKKHMKIHSPSHKRQVVEQQQQQQQ